MKFIFHSHCYYYYYYYLFIWFFFYYYYYCYYYHYCHSHYHYNCIITADIIIVIVVFIVINCPIFSWEPEGHFCYTVEYWIVKLSRSFKFASDNESANERLATTALISILIDCPLLLSHSGFSLANYVFFLKKCNFKDGRTKQHERGGKNHHSVQLQAVNFNAYVSTMCCLFNVFFFC